ncbi:hypothetical protein CMK19_03660 [Candidatus Poribacteria bacterium]|nr:hypothetical protein [Candidatus Poribacteria bacterium]
MLCSQSTFDRAFIFELSFLSESLLFLFVILGILVNNASATNPTIDLETQERQQEFKEKATAKIRGRVVWPGSDLTHTTVQLYVDEQLKIAYTSVVQLKDGFFEVLVETGSYYVVAFVDVNQTAVFDFGDGMGIYGVNDWADSAQEKRIVEISSGQIVENIKIEITARLADLNGKQKMVPVNSYQPSKSQMFQSQLELISSGVSGQLSWGDGLPHILFENALVMAYSDASWNYKVAQTKASNDGQFKLNIQRGKYYLMAIIDKNQNNRFDTGDYVGAFGIQNLRSDFPTPVFIDPNQFMEGVTVEISGRKSKNGRITPIKARLLSGQTASDSMISVSGKIIGLKQEIEKALVLAYTSPALLSAVAVSEVRADGSFSFSFPSDHVYYLLASVDVDQDGTYSTGDLVGGYGTLDLVNDPPQALTLPNVDSTEQLNNLQILLTATYGADGQLIPMAEIPTVPTNLDSIPNGISGRILTNDIYSVETTKYREVIISVSKTDDFSQAIAIPIDVGSDGYYKIPLMPEDYYVMAVIDLNGDRKAGINDGVGVFGTRRPVRGKPQMVSVYKDQIITNIDIQIAAIFTDQLGNITEVEVGHRPEIRIQHGQPDDVYQIKRGSRLVEEWWYWKRGIGFVFESTRLGWELKDEKKFKAQPIAEKTQQSKISAGRLTQIGTHLFYSYDGVIWAYSPEGSHQPIGLGNSPSTSLNGQLIYQNDQGEVMISKKGEKASVFLNRRDFATDATVSPDGKKVAFARQLTDRARIFIRDIESDYEISVPSVALEMGMPAWNITSKLLAYVGTGEIGSKDDTGKATRNIYSYDLKSNRIDSISVGPNDDTTPVWSPVDMRRLAFCRLENDRQQIWLIEFDDYGQPNENQLTQNGGKSPVWLPNGSGLIYENNGQLWLATWPGNSVDQVEFVPLTINGQNVFGYHPSLVPEL